MAIFIQKERLDYPIQFRILVIINFICENFLSTEAVLTGIDRQMFSRVLMFGNMVLGISFVLSSVNCEYKVSFSCLDKQLQNIFHSIPISGDINDVSVIS